MHFWAGDPSVISVQDTQTVSTNEEGQYVVHVDTVIGSQDGDNAPTITNSQDDFVIPIGILSMHSLSAYTVHAIHFQEYYVE